MLLNINKLDKTSLDKPKFLRPTLSMSFSSLRLLATTSAPDSLPINDLCSARSMSMVASCLVTMPGQVITSLYDQQKKTIIKIGEFWNFVLLSIQPIADLFHQNLKNVKKKIDFEENPWWFDFLHIKNFFFNIFQI